MLHVSQLSWGPRKHPGDVLTLGQKIKVENSENRSSQTGKIGLSYRETFENPSDKQAARYPITARMSIVTKLIDSRILTQSGIEGLVHISELSHRRMLP